VAQVDDKRGYNENHARRPNLNQLGGDELRRTGKDD
jgi:hypothetical protein